MDDASADIAALLPFSDRTPEPTKEEDPNSTRIVVLGKTGAGKSSACNTIFGEDVFKINHTANTGTSECAAETRSVSGRSITFTDTPGFFDTGKSEEELKAEIAKCIIECAPGPHAFMILLQVDKFTKQEKQVIDEIQNTFSEEAFKYAVVVFTHGDQLTEGQKIEEFVKQNKGLRDLMKKCGGRCHVVDNKYWKNKQQDLSRSNQVQVAELLSTIDKMKKNGGCYTNEMLQTVYRMIIMFGKDEVYNILKMSAGITTGALLGALLGVSAMIRMVVVALKKMLILIKVGNVVVGAVGAGGGAGGAAVGGAAGGAAAGAAAGGAMGGAAGGAMGGAAGGAAAGGAMGGGAMGGAAGGAVATTGLYVAAGAVGVAAAVGAGVGGCIGYHEADKAETVMEAIVNTADAVWDKTMQM